MSKARKLELAVTIYLILKPIFNFLVLGGSLMPLAFGIAAGIFLWFGISYANTVIAILLMLVACANMPTNLQNIGFNMYLIYAAEGVIDMGCAVLLAFHPQIRSHCRRGE